ncbi:hypothetical protein B5M50_05625 [candidate division KSB1 bacterium 4484_219]|nr:MAG: hypothetical protein B5M50_05625 [candidate division KSB1 bacterium 4484_219]HEY61546.1 ABC transporter permease [Anaerolineae bacterium]
MSHLKTLVITAYYEWKIQIRQRSTWVVAGLFFLVAWMSIDYAKLPLDSAIRFALGTAQGMGLFGGLFIVIIGATGFLREFKPGYNFLWTHSFSTRVYILGKFLGICMTAATALLPVGLWVASLMVNLHGFQSVFLQIKVWSVVLAPTLVFILAVTFLVGLLFRRPLWTSLVLLLVIVATLVMNLDITHLIGFALYGIYGSSLIGYGPDNLLVTLNRFFYLELSVLSLLIVLLLARILTTRQENKSSPVWKLIWGTLTVVNLIAIFYTASNFQIESNRLSENPPSNPLEAEAMDCSFMRSYQIDLVLNQKTKSLDGEVVFLLQPNAISQQIPIRLNGGLNISKIESTPPGVKGEVVKNTLVLNFPAELKGRDVSITLKYAGSINIPRYAYDNLFRSQELSVAPFPPGGYVDDKTIFLVRDGNWHPFSWCALDQLSIGWIGVPNSGIVQTADRMVSYPDRVTLIWDQQPPLPLLATSQNYDTFQMTESRFFVSPDNISDREFEVVYNSYPVLLKQIDLFLQEEKRSSSQPYQIATVPLLKYSLYDPSTRIYLLPESRDVTHLLINENNEKSQTVINSPELLYRRWVATDVLRAWWCSSNPCLQLQAEVGYHPIQFGISGFEGKTVLDALISYASLQLAEPLVGQQFIAEEIAARQHAMEDPIFFTSLVQLPSLYSTETNSLVVQLHGLWEQADPETFWQLVREYHRQFGNTSLSEEDFARFVLKVTGFELP